MSKKNAAGCKKCRGLKVFLTVVFVLLVACLAAVCIFRDEIAFIYSGMTSSSEALASRGEENDKKTHELLEQIAEVTMRDLSEEERKQLASGMLSYEDALALIMGKEPIVVTAEVVTEKADVPVEVTDASAQTVAKPSVPEETTAETSKATEKANDSLISPEELEKYKNRINEIIAEIYLLRATYLNKIDGLIESVRKEYARMSESQHTLSTKISLVEKKLVPAGNALEKECDQSMNILLDELKGILKTIGSGTDIIKEIEKTYAEQKEIKKAELINKYMPQMSK